MTRRGSATATTAALTALLLLGGCSGSGAGAGPTPSASPSASTDSRARCAAVSTRLVSAVQGYVDTFGPAVSAPATATPAPSPSPSTSAAGGLQQALAATKTDLKAHGCDLNQFRARFGEAMKTVRARGPVAHAVLLRLGASLGGSLGTQPVHRTVRPRQDLEQVLSHLAGGSVVTLTAGEYRLARPLVLLAGVTLRGQGRGRTRITGRAGGSVLLALTNGKVELDRLGLQHLGPGTASVLVGGPTSRIVLSGVGISGARSSKAARGTGGSGITMTAAPGSTARRTTTLQVTDSEIIGNSGAGILLSGGHRASIRASHFARNGQCGVCFAGASSGAVRTSLFEGNAVGVAVLDTARPLIERDSFLDGLVGVQVSGSAEPDVRRSAITGASRAGMIFGGTSSGRVDGMTCTQVPYGIVVSPHAVPLLGTNSCSLARGR